MTSSSPIWNLSGSTLRTARAPARTNGAFGTRDIQLVLDFFGIHNESRGNAF